MATPQVTGFTAGSFISDRPAKLFEINEANALVKLLTDGEEDGWTYEVCPIGDAHAHINVYDEENVFTGKF